MADRRAELVEIAKSESVSQEDFDAICDEFPRVIAELEQTKRERDEVRKHHNSERTEYFRIAERLRAALESVQEQLDTVKP